MKKKTLIFFALSATLLALTLSSTPMAALGFEVGEIKSSSFDSIFSNATLVSDGYGGMYWNDGESKSPSIAVDDRGVPHAVWQDGTDGPWGTDAEIMYSRFDTDIGWSSPVAISNGYGGWNTGGSYSPSIAIDLANNIHVVWHDYTVGPWGTDPEIMYVNYTPTSGWSNATVISDGYGGVYWNDQFSHAPTIAVDQANNIHVVWYDETDGPWGTDDEIMYVNFTPASGWSNATVISDGYGGMYWNDGVSEYPSIATDQANNIHVVWQDGTDGAWGTSHEIMYVKFTPTSGWSNITVISDGHGEMYPIEGISYHPSVAVDDAGVHVVWNDHSDGPWGTDGEIMYSNNLYNLGWSSPIVISDGYGGIYWNDGNSVGPQIAAGGTGLYIIWQDYSDGPWNDGSGDEIWCVSITPGHSTPDPFELTSDATDSDGPVLEFIQDYGTLSGMGVIAVLIVISGIGKKQKKL